MKTFSKMSAALALTTALLSMGPHEDALAKPPITPKKSCGDYGGCATVPATSVGDHIILKRENTTIREIKDPLEFATARPVVFDDVKTNCGGLKYFDEGDTMEISWRHATNDYDMSLLSSKKPDPFLHVLMWPERKLYKTTAEVRTDSIYWLSGMARTQNNQLVTIYVYLVNTLDKKSNAMEKRYRVDIFNSSCAGDSPVVDGNLEYPKEGKKEPTSGNGWEPHR